MGESLQKVLDVGASLIAKNVHTMDPYGTENVNHILVKQLQIIGEEVLDPEKWQGSTNMQQALSLFEHVCQILEKSLLEMNYDDYQSMTEVEFLEYRVGISGEQFPRHIKSYAEIFENAKANWGLLEYKSRLTVCPKIFVMFFSHENAGLESLNVELPKDEFDQDMPKRFSFDPYRPSKKNYGYDGNWIIGYSRESKKTSWKIGGDSIELSTYENSESQKPLPYDIFREPKSAGNVYYYKGIKVKPEFVFKNGGWQEYTTTKQLKPDVPIIGLLDNAHETFKLAEKAHKAATGAELFKQFILPTDRPIVA